MSNRNVHAAAGALLAVGLIYGSELPAQSAPPPGTTIIVQPAPASRPPGSVVPPLGNPVPPLGNPVPPLGNPVPPLGNPIPALGNPVPALGNPVPSLDAQATRNLQPARLYTTSNVIIPARTETAEGAFRLLDPTNRGYVTRTEVSQIPGFAGLGSAVANGGERLNQEEFAVAWRQYSGH